MREPATYFAGLPNTGASCWANSLLQALCALGPLHTHLQRVLRASVEQRGATPGACALVEVSSALRDLSAPRGSPATVAPPRLSILRAAGQQDAHELLMVLLRALFERAPVGVRSTSAWFFSTAAAPALGGRPLLPAPAPAAGGTPLIMHHPFSFLLARRTRCVGCGWAGAWVVDAEASLEVALPALRGDGAAAPLAALVRGALGEAHAEGWRCEGGCGSARGAARATLLLRAPRVLAVHIKREGVWGVNRAPVAVPLALALPVGGGGGARPAAAEFELAAALCHVGASGGGHFFTVRRAHARVRARAPRRWLRASDAHVEELPERALFSPWGEWATRDATLLFYLAAGNAVGCVGAAGAAAGGGGEEEAVREAEVGLAAALAAAAAADGGSFEGALNAAGGTAGLLPLLVPAAELPRGCGHEAVDLP
jgi:hypothetical protein